jgi:hypothetical protein
LWSDANQSIWWIMTTVKPHTAYPSWAPELTYDFSGIRIAGYLRNILVTLLILYLLWIERKLNKRLLLIFFLYIISLFRH